MPELLNIIQLWYNIKKGSSHSFLLGNTLVWYFSSNFLLLGYGWMLRLN